MDQDLLAQLVIVALVAVLVLVAVVAVLATKVARLRRDYSQALGEDHREGLFAAVRSQVDQLETLRADLGVVHNNTEMLRDLIRDTVSRVGVVRYDAFEDMGGALSFSAALLDERGDGVVISAINGRSETRTYAKAVEGGTSEHHISDEEQAAITQAMSGPAKAETTVVGSGRRRRRAG